MKYRASDIEVSAEDPFKNDVLERKPIVELVAGMVERLAGPFVLAVDSPWGSGKTAFIRMLKAVLEQRTFQCLYFNAWETDYMPEALVALVSSIDEIQLSQKAASTGFRRHMKTAKAITTAVARRGTVAAVKAATFGALELDKEFEAVAAELTAGTTSDIVDEFRKEKDALKKLRSELENAISQLKSSGKRENLIFFVDELDRCRPSFAIEMLERIKHLFDLPNIVFVLSIDKAQLESITKAVYGQGINSKEYLRRFIDLEIGLPVVRTKQFVEALLLQSGLADVFKKRTGELRYDEENFVDFFTMLADAFQLTLRARERCITRLCVVMDQTPSNHYLDPILVALLVVLRSHDEQMFASLFKGQIGSEKVMEYITGLPSGFARTAREGVALEAYLLATDPNEERKNARTQQLKAWATSTEQSPQNTHASEILGMLGHLRKGFRDLPRIDFIAKKVDLAAMIR